MLPYYKREESLLGMMFCLSNGSLAGLKFDGRKMIQYGNIILPPIFIIWTMRPYGFFVDGRKKSSVLTSNLGMGTSIAAGGKILGAVTAVCLLCMMEDGEIRQ